MKRKFWLNSSAVALVMFVALSVGCSKPSRTDAQVSGEVQSKLGTDSALQGQPVSVTAKDGVVTLSGTVNSDAARMAASNDAGSVEGVKQVLNNLSVQQAAAQPPTAQPQAEAQPDAASSEPAPATRSRARVQPRPSARRQAPTPTYTAPPPAAVSSGSNSGSNSYDTTANNAAPAAPATPPAPQRVTIPDGTPISIRLSEALSSERAQVGQTFRASLNNPIEVGDNIVVPEGADIEGRITDVKAAAHFAGASLLAVELTKLQFNGHTYQLHTNTWQKQGNARGKNTAAKVGGGAALGAIIGGIAGGGKGAAIGGAIGAGAGTGAQAVTRGEEIRLPAETALNFTLDSPITVYPSSSNGRRRMDVPNPDQP